MPPVIPYLNRSTLVLSRLEGQGDGTALPAVMTTRFVRCLPLEGSHAENTHPFLLFVEFVACVGEFP